MQEIKMQSSLNNKSDSQYIGLNVVFLRWVGFWIIGGLYLHGKLL